MSLDQKSRVVQAQLADKRLQVGKMGSIAHGSKGAESGIQPSEDVVDANGKVSMKNVRCMTNRGGGFR